MRKYIFSLIVALSSLSAAFAATVTETFESVSITNGGQGLSNDWIVVGGTIASTSSTNVDNIGRTAYALWIKGHNSSEHSLTAQGSSSNDGIIVIPQPLKGTFSFYARASSDNSVTKKTAKVRLYSVAQSGDTYTQSSLLKEWVLSSTSWSELSFDLGTTADTIAIYMTNSVMDDITYTIVDSSEKHEHNYATEWSHDESGHWHACTNETGLCDATKKDFAAHDGAICSICGYKVPGIDSFPWNVDLSTVDEGAIPNGWDNSEGEYENAAQQWRVEKGSVNSQQTKYLRFNGYTNPADNYNRLITPLIYVPATGDYTLNFDLKNVTALPFKLRIAEYGGTATDLTDNLSTESDWEEQAISLKAYAGKAVKIYFVAMSTAGTGDAYVYLKNISVSEFIVHEHDYATTWSYDRDQHWHACLSTTGVCSALRADLEDHDFDENDVCTICGYSRPWLVDFSELSAIPCNWVTDGWKVDNGNGSSMASSRGTNECTLYTPTLRAEKDDTLEIETYLLYTDDSLAISYSTDEGQNWIEIATLLPKEDHLSWTSGETITQKFAAPEKGEYVLRFYGKNVFIKRITGFKAKDTLFTAISDMPAVPAQTGTYDLMGRKVATMQPGGIYIDNGKLKIIY